ncbi:MAG TPA: hypothetical protein VEQ35_05370 [Beijerinckia sp.]|nr:hypothetical protein [Beijerinckia sp.]
MFRTIGETASNYLSSQTVFKINNHFDVEKEVRRFYEAYLDTPFRAAVGGGRFGNLLWLDLIAKSIQPDVIVDSGTHMGGSAWALSQGAPDARIFSFDIDLTRLALKAENVQYVEQDWASFDFDKIPRQTSICLFDEMLDHGKRLSEAAARKFQLAIFSDDFAVFDFRMLHGGRALPKISYLLDKSLEDGEVIEWVAQGTKYSWKVDRARLDQLATLIGAIDRLPNLVAPLGIEQLPYRIIAINNFAPQSVDQAAAAFAQ